MLSAEFEMKELGKAKRILGMDINKNRSKGKLFLSQQGYIKKVVEKFRMHESKPVSTPLGQHDNLSTKDAPNSDEERERMRLIPYSNGMGSIMYYMVCSRPDLAYVVNMVSRFMTNLRPKHWGALKWVFRYLNDSLSSSLKFKRKMKSEEPIKGYTNSNFAGNISTRKSLFAYVFTFFGTVVSWRSVLQLVLALSTTEAEFIALTKAVKEAR